MALNEETITIDKASALTGYLARPSDAAPRPPVLVIYEIFGLTNNIRNAAARLADAGYVALAPDFFRHDPVPYNQFAEARRVSSSLSDAGAMSDIAASIDYLQSQPYVRTGPSAVLGFCMGGRIAFLAACKLNTRIGACVDFYGARLSGGRVHEGQTMVPLDEAASLRCPVQLFFGDQDSFIPPEEVEIIRDRLDDLGASFEIELYPDAGHGFCCEERDSYHPAAAADAWARALQFLEATIRA
ncbi:MAG TPA: dienelactone hydrolase family protein [Armatimonadota bacterium]|nr:dienelactone hydrolase family protein [Armatimonadota bacterium]